MFKTKESELILDDIRYLIDYSNLQDNLLYKRSNIFCNLDDFKSYSKDISMGIPMLLPTNLDYFDYDNYSSFKLNKEDIANKIFMTDKLDYIGVKQFIEKGLEFSTGGTPVEKSLNIISYISDINKKCKDLVNALTKKGKTVCAFQTRNIPHLGHERIIEEGLKHCDYIIVNPLIGLRKKGDFKTEVIEKAFQFLIENFYGNKVIYAPIIANMFYAGPREAFHHSIIRQNIGFTHFIVGRDHAGAEGVYDEDAAFKNLKRNKLNIEVIPIEGAYYCTKKKSAVIKGVDNYDENNLISLSGTKFREAIISNTDFEFVRPELLNYIKKLGGNIFE